MDLIAKIRSTHNELGTFDTVLYMMDKLLSKVTFGNCTLHKYYITHQPVAVHPSVPPNKALDIDVKQISADSPALQAIDRPLSVLQQRAKQGGICFAAFKRGEFAGNIWLNIDKYIEDEVRCIYVLSPSGCSAWDYDVFVQPRYRLSYVFAKLWDSANQFMADREIHSVYSRINYYNIRSLQSHKRLGSKVVGSAYFLNVFNCQVLLSRKFSPYIHFSINNNCKPELVIKD